MRSPLARVRHLGSAHGGTEHFWRQRLTGAANVPLVIAAVVIIVAAAARPYADVVAILHSPFVAAVFILFFVSASIHMRIGMQVIVEDYVSGEGLKVLLLGASTLFSITVAAVAILAVVKLAVGG
jgi:succinate dehydrogenase / fumarate reductase membrane anchor subunit